MYQSTGILKYSIDWTGYKLICKIEQDIVDYYYGLIPKYLDVRTQMYKAHISIVRWERVESDLWGNFEGFKVPFFYDSVIHCNEKYYWINAHSIEFQNIREQLGLPRFRKGFDCFHISLGNIKNTS